MNFFSICFGSTRTVTAAVTAFFVFSLSSAGANDVIQVCGEQFAPYSYSEKNSDGTFSNRLSGATIDLLAEISKQSQYQFEVSLIPWKRCETEVSRYGQGGRYEMMIDASSTEKRMKNYTRTIQMYSNSMHLFDSKNKYPNGYKESSLEGLKGKVFCGFLGHNQTWLELLVDGAIIDYNSSSWGNVFKKLSRKRCDVYATSPTLVRGAILMGQLELPDDIDHVIFPDADVSRFYHWISNNSDRKLEVVKVINEFVEGLQSEEYEIIYRRYFDGGSARFD